MDSVLTNKLLEIGKQFRLKGVFFSYEEITIGNVNRTYKINYIMDDGNGMAKIKSYMVQRLNTYAFKNPEQLMSNIDRVTEYIRRQYPERVNLHFHHTASGDNYLVDGNDFWRVFNYIESVTFDSTDDSTIVYNTGKAFGEFQTMLAEFEADLLYYTIPDFHNTRKRYETLLADIKEDKLGRVKECGAEIEWLMSVMDKACALTDMYDRGELPLRVTHNDTKINNVLFDVNTHEPLTVIDLDTVMPGLVGHDFGDAVRFAVNFTTEDSADTSKTGLDLNTFWAFTKGFLKPTVKALTENEISTLALGCFAITCELATRFLDDYIVGDVYFNTHCEGHNLIRTRCQIALAKDMLQKLDAMDAIVRLCADKYRANDN